MHRLLEATSGRAEAPATTLLHTLPRAVLQSRHDAPMHTSSRVATGHPSIVLVDEEAGILDGLRR